MAHRITFKAKPETIDFRQVKPDGGEEVYYPIPKAVNTKHFGIDDPFHPWQASRIRPPERLVRLLDANIDKADLLEVYTRQGPRLLIRAGCAAVTVKVGKEGNPLHQVTITFNQNPVSWG